jgi:phospholipase C
MPPSRFKHLIVVMLENRSFDHMLGYLNLVGTDGRPLDGVLGKVLSNPNTDGQPAPVNPDAVYQGDYGVDTPHDFGDVNIQLFGVDPPPAGVLATNQGFVKAYGTKVNNDPQKAMRVMKLFSPARVPVISTLAQQFAVCERWYSSVPGPTLPNRAFAHAATSNSHVDMSPTAYINVRSVYQALDEQGVSSRVYSFDGNTLAFTFRTLFTGGGKFLGTFSDFLDELNGDLPAYCFVEPRFNEARDDARHEFFLASDQHPDNDVREGERLLAAIYKAFRSSQRWLDSLMVILYDEHGGLYDHVPPPSDNVASPGPPEPLTGFKFDRLGLRVPAIMVSPFVRAGTILRETAGDRQRFDHTSLIATARAILAPNMKPLTDRDANARTFETVAELDVPRTDTPDALDFHEAPLIPEPAQAALHGTGPLDEHQMARLMAAYHADMTMASGRRVLGNDVAAKSINDIKTEQQAAEYIGRVAGKFAPGVFAAS